MQLRNLSCCGVKEIDGLRNDPKETLKAFFPHWLLGADRKKPRGAVVLFSDTVGRNNGIKLGKYITKNKLGELVETTPQTNPNSGNKIQAWLWRVDNPAFRKWGLKNVPNAKPLKRLPFTINTIIRDTSYIDKYSDGFQGLAYFKGRSKKNSLCVLMQRFDGVSGAGERGCWLYPIEELGKCYTATDTEIEKAKEALKNKEEDRLAEQIARALGKKSSGFEATYDF